MSLTSFRRLLFILRSVLSLGSTSNYHRHPSDLAELAQRAPRYAHSVVGQLCFLTFLQRITTRKPSSADSSSSCPPCITALFKWVLVSSRRGFWRRSPVHSRRSQSTRPVPWSPLLLLLCNLLRPPPPLWLSRSRTVE